MLILVSSSTRQIWHVFKHTDSPTEQQVLLDTTYTIVPCYKGIFKSVLQQLLHLGGRSFKIYQIISSRFLHVPPPPKQNKKHIASWTVNYYIAIIFQILLLSGKGKMEKKN